MTAKVAAASRCCFFPGDGGEKRCEYAHALCLRMCHNLAYDATAARSAVGALYREMMNEHAA